MQLVLTEQFFLPPVFSIPESSTVHVTVPSAPIVSSVRVSIPLEYLTSSVNFQSTNPAFYSNAPSYQHVSIPQRNSGYHGYGSFHHGMGYGGPSWSQLGSRFPALICSQQDLNNVLRTPHELFSSLSELENQTQSRLDKSSNHTSVSANQQNISGQGCLADEVDNNGSSYEGEDQYSDVSPYSPNSNIDPADQEAEPLGYGDAIADVFQLLGDKCPRQEDSGTKRILSTLERSKVHGNDKSFERLPHSEVVNHIVTEFSRDSKDSWRKVEWSVNAKVLKSNTAPRSYKVHKQYWPTSPPTSLPTLYEAANRVGMTSSKDIRVPVSFLESTEKLARQAVTEASHCDLFLAAADSALEQENFNVASLKNLLLAASRTARHSCGLGVAISAYILHWRRNAALSMSRILLQSSKDSLRAAPLDSDTLFGNLVSEISKRNLSDQHHHVLAKVSQTPQHKQGQKRPQSSERNKGENFEQKSPLLNSAPQNRNYQPRGGKRGGRGRFSNSRPKYFNK